MSKTIKIRICGDCPHYRKSASNSGEGYCHLEDGIETGYAMGPPRNCPLPSDTEPELRAEIDKLNRLLDTATRALEIVTQSMEE